MEEPYASFSDLHSRPASVHTTRSFYSLGLGEDDDRSSFGPAPPVPPIPAAYSSTTSLPMRERERSVLPYDRSGSSFLGRLSLGTSGKYRLDDLGSSGAGLARPPLIGGEGSVYSGMVKSEQSPSLGQRDSIGTMDGQRWIDEYTQSRETFRSGTSISVLNRPLSHKIV